MKVLLILIFRNLRNYNYLPNNGKALANNDPQWKNYLEIKILLYKSTWPLPTNSNTSLLLALLPRNALPTLEISHSP